MTNIKSGIRSGVNIAGIMIVGLLLDSFFWGQLYRLSNNEVFMYGSLFTMVIVSMLTLVFPSKWVVSNKNIKIAEGVCALIGSFIVSFSLMILIALIIAFVSPGYAEALGFAGFPIVFSGLLLMGHIAAFIIQLIKYFKQKGVSKQ
ncbi:MAG: hypothetical protein WC500_02575 [Candidatus Margulisiibacteriota bacterium]